ncbi:carboxypeptidase regulatory-like domain-containing protein [Glaciibacter flavus]|uniref:alpha-amylase n=1 Tax=Orlajensenia flava TaxID=2565934 RepID=A0A4S4FV60_9MICO|nr:carboxypeptidase regulatory-like domain-containing protein [Glaciibacter flavus]THG33902.1 carboxypeptidase regulatory-like domain-containing protein [Glaciibacter flavus]
MPAVIPRRVRAFASGLLVAALTVGGVALGASPAIADDAGSITGVVSGAAPDASAIASARVTAYPDGSTNSAAGTITAADGSYSLIGLQSGAYRVAVHQQSPSQWVDQPVVAGWFGMPTLDELATLPVVQVVAGQAANNDIVLPHYSSISGTVSNDADGSPVAGASVYASPEAGSSSSNAVTGVDGTFTLMVTPGTYRLNVNPVDGLVLASTSDPITIGVGDVVTGLDVRMARGATISGTVTYSTGGPAVGAPVSVRDPAGTGTINATSTDASGHYTLDSVPTGTYAIGFGFGDLPASFHPIWYGGSDDISSATPVSVTVGDEVDGIDAVVVPSTESMTPGTVRIIGNATPGETLQVDTGIWVPTLFTWRTQWLRDGEPIPDAVWSPYYTVADADLGHRLTVEIIGSAVGYVPTAATSAPTEVVRKRMTPGTPTIAGSPQVGKVLTAKPGTWTPGGATFDYQWLRWGQDIPGATSRTYTVAPADQGRGLSVRLTGHKSGWGPTSATSSWTGQITPAPSVTAGTVTISGKARLYRTLTAHTGSWAPNGLDFGYQWMRNGTPIAGATQKTYTVLLADIGAGLSVQVTGAKTGYDPTVVVSASTATVPTPLPSVLKPAIALFG